MKVHARLAIVALAICLSASVNEAPAQESSRVNAAVKAVRKVKPSVVAIKVPGANPSAKGTVGTGIIIDERGYIITNRHVLGGASNVIVRLADETELTAKILVADSSTDLAVLKVNANRPLPALQLGRSDDIEPGEDIIAVGHPYGYAFTVTKGIVGALGRKIELPNGAVLTGLIQHDAPINPGNSGGPLLNIDGDFIGINTALRDGANGIAFAINTGTIKRVLAEKLSAVQVAGVSHGLQVQETVTDASEPHQQVIVAGLTDTSAAAGLRKGDVIRTVGNVAVANSFDLERALWDAKPGQQIRVAVSRDGQDVSVTLTLTAGRVERVAATARQ